MGSPVNLKGEFPLEWINRVFFSAKTPDTFLYTDPRLLECMQENDAKVLSWPNGIQIIFKKGVAEKLDATLIKPWFVAYGDFKMYKDSDRSVILDFLFIDPKTVKS